MTAARRERPIRREISWERPEFVARFIAADADNEGFFQASANAGKSMFDLPGYIGMRLRAAGVGAFQNLDLDTYSDERRFFSYRRSVHREEPDFGRLVAAIALPE